MRLRPILASVAILSTAPLFAADPPPPPPPVWSGQAGLSFVSTSGNSRTETFGAGGEVDYAKDPWSGLAKLAFLRASATDKSTGVDTVSAESTAGTLRGARKIVPRLEGFAQGDYLRNTFAGIDRRLVGTAGVGWTAVDQARHSLKVLLGIGYTKENRETGDNLGFAMASVGLGYKCKITPTSEFDEDFLYTEDLKDTGDWRIANTASLSAAVSTLLSLKASYTLSYLKEPVAGFGRTDTVTSVALVAKF